jgi:hypothetical protein
LKEDNSSVPSTITHNPSSSPLSKSLTKVTIMPAKSSNSKRMAVAAAVAVSNKMKEKDVTRHGCNCERAVDKIDDEIDAFKLQVENRTTNDKCEPKPWD